MYSKKVLRFKFLQIFSIMFQFLLRLLANIMRNLRASILQNSMPILRI